MFKSHYDYLDSNFKKFVSMLPVSNFWKEVCESMIVADGDKCYGYRREWEKCGVPFNHGVCVYLISKMTPYQSTVRNTENGWVPVDGWVVDMYHNQGMKEILENVDKGVV